MDERTSEPDVRIIAREPGFVRYHRLSTGRTWTVSGRCDRRGDCLIGAVIDGEEVRTLERARALAAAYAGPDVPVVPGFSGCCPLVVTDGD